MRTRQHHKRRPQPHRELAGLVLLLGFVLSISACSRPDPWRVEDPTEALKVYLQALNFGATDVAWEFLLPEDRAVIEKRRDAFDALANSTVSRAPWDLLSPGHIISTPRDYASVTVDAEASNGERTVITVVLHNEQSFEVIMIRQDERWYVDLPLERLAPSLREHSVLHPTLLPAHRRVPRLAADEALAYVVLSVLNAPMSHLIYTTSASAPRDHKQEGYDG